MWQVSMAEYIFDVPCSRKPFDANRRCIIFDITLLLLNSRSQENQYILSK
jgi:hypothetical protein